MGICVSVQSPEIHQADYSQQENTLYFAQNAANDESRKLGSLWSKQGSKGLNQDAAILYQDYGFEDGVFCGVFDGHGKNGHFVSKMVRNRLPSLLLSQKTSMEMNGRGRVEKLDGESMHSLNVLQWGEACVSAFKVMDKEIKLQENLDCSCSGTTAVVVVREGEDLIIANLGDSRAVLGTMTENGIMAIQLTTDLKPGLPGEANRIRKCNGRVITLKEELHIQRVWLPDEDSPGLAMSRAFGDFLLKNHGVIAIPDVSHRRLTPDDQFIVLATDGVWDMLSNQQVASIVCRADSQHAAARAVVEAANAAWKRRFPTSRIDDCTAVCLFLHKRQQQSFPPVWT
ncbi:hypothetical protein SLE2022_036980 [Rubroshorea leprosula]